MAEKKTKAPVEVKAEKEVVKETKTVKTYEKEYNEVKAELTATKEELETVRSAAAHFEKEVSEVKAKRAKEADANKKAHATSLIGSCAVLAASIILAIVFAVFDTNAVVNVQYNCFDVGMGYGVTLALAEYFFIAIAVFTGIYTVIATYFKTREE